MALGLDAAGAVVATFAIIGALTGLGAGVVVRRLGTHRALVCGMLAISIGNIIGANAPNEAILLAARTVEGVGFFGVYWRSPACSV
jgi:predicted MFS family arabinose efflux permease